MKYVKTPNREQVLEFAEVAALFKEMQRRQLTDAYRLTKEENHIATFGETIFSLRGVWGGKGIEVYTLMDGKFLATVTTLEGLLITFEMYQ